MEYLLLIICILTASFGVSIVCCARLNNEVKSVNKKLAETSSLCNDLIYNNCVLSDRIEKIKNLNLIDYSNNDYYKELLTTEII